MPNANCQASFLFKAKEKTEPCIFFIHGSWSSHRSEWAEVNDRNSRAAHKDIFPTDISMKNARAMDRR